MGITGGLVDVGNLFDCLDGIHKGLVDEPDVLLDRYDQVRREKWHKIINPVSSGNIQTMWSDEAKLRDSPVIRISKEAEADPGKLLELIKVRYISLLREDSTSS